MDNLEFFRVNTREYQPDTDYWVTRPASINHPKNHSVMFITKNYPQYQNIFFSVSQCLIFWPSEWEIPAEIAGKNAVIPCENPHLAYGEFFAAHHITGLYQPELYRIINGAFIAEKAKIGEDTTIFPGVYIGGDVIIGDHCFIGAGVKIVGRVRIGNRVWIRENTVIGTDGLSTDRDGDGHPVEIPQFGGVIIEDDVKIGANVVIARGAIDNTVLAKGCKIDNMSFVSHNVKIGEESFVVGMTIMFGSSSVGQQAQISGGCALGNYTHVGSYSLVGIGSVVTKDIPDNRVAYGTPAKPIRKRFEE